MDQDLGVVITHLEHVREDIGEIKENVKSLDKREAEFERMYVKEHTILADKAEDAHKRIDKQEDEISTLKNEVRVICDKLSPIIQGHKIMVFIGAALGMSVLALIWSLITGNVELLFR